MDELSRILIVDDEQQNIKVLAKLLWNDYKIMASRTGEQALSVVFGPNPPDLILLDIMMPDMDGYEVCRRLKENQRTKNIPVIFVTAITELEDAAKGFQIGAVDFIEKPLNPIIVKARVDLYIKLYQTIHGLKEALSQVKKLSGLLPICMHCKKIRDDNGYWSQVEDYLGNNSEAQFRHCICQECAKSMLTDFMVNKPS